MRYRRRRRRRKDLYAHFLHQQHFSHGTHFSISLISVELGTWLTRCFVDLLTEVGFSIVCCDNRIMFRLCLITSAPMWWSMAALSILAYGTLPVIQLTQYPFIFLLNLFVFCLEFGCEMQDRKITTD